MTPKQEVEKLMNDLVPFAKQMLAERGAFYPFGGYLKPSGEIAHVGAQIEGTDYPDPEKMLVLLEKSFCQKADHRECRATAILADVRIVPPGGGQKSDAIQVMLAHEQGYSATVFYPYIKTEEGFTFQRIFAQQGDGRIFK